MSIVYYDVKTLLYYHEKLIKIQYFYINIFIYFKLINYNEFNYVN